MITLKKAKTSLLQVILPSSKNLSYLIGRFIMDPEGTRSMKLQRRTFWHNHLYCNVKWREGCANNFWCTFVISLPVLLDAWWNLSMNIIRQPPLHCLVPYFHCVPYGWAQLHSINVNILYRVKAIEAVDKSMGGSLSWNSTRVNTGTTLPKKWNHIQIGYDWYYRRRNRPFSYSTKDSGSSFIFIHFYTRVLIEWR